MKPVNQDTILKNRGTKKDETLTFDPELAALASYRAYVNVSTNTKAHDWTENSSTNRNMLTDAYSSYLTTQNKTLSKFGENTADGTLNEKAQQNMSEYLKTGGMQYGNNYRTSEPHWNALMSPDYTLIGISPTFCDVEINNTTSQFQILANSR